MYDLSQTALNRSDLLTIEDNLKTNEIKLFEKK